MAELTLKKKYTKREFQARADEILGLLTREVSAFGDVSEAAKQARREKSRTDHFYFFKTYLLRRQRRLFGVLKGYFKWNSRGG
jgi:hypothetical protein